MKKDSKYYRSFLWSSYQRNIFKEVSEGTRNIAVEAVAGSGKSTVLKGIVHWLETKTKIRIFAFNKAIADKLRDELPKRVGIGTAHSYGMSMIMGATGSYDNPDGLKVDENKYHTLAHKAIQQLMREATGSKSANYPNFSSDVALKGLHSGIVQVARFIRIAIPEFKFRPISDMLKEYNIVLPYNIRFWSIKLAMGCVIQGNELASNGVIDFEDMLYIPHLWKLYPKGKMDLIMVDEVQDTSCVMQSLYDKFVEKGAKLVAVGDSAQSINSFMGAVPGSFNLLKYRHNCIELPLPVSYRCPASHILLAQQLVPHIQFKPDAIAGQYQTVNRRFLYDNVKANDLILSRYNAPLVEVCVNLVLDGVKAYIRGKDIGERLCSIVRMLCKNHPLPRLPHELHEWVLSMQSESDEDDDGFESQQTADLARAIQACYDAFGNQCSTVAIFEERIKSLFSSDLDSDRTDSIVLSTVHSAKGDEADTVYILDSETLPIEKEDYAAEVEEFNLLYVAITRSKHLLYFVCNSTEPNNVGNIIALRDLSTQQKDLLSSFNQRKEKQTQQQLALF